MDKEKKNGDQEKPDQEKADHEKADHPSEPSRQKLENMRLDHVPSRVRKLLVLRSGSESTSRESRGSASGPPSEKDVDAIARKLRGMSEGVQAAHRAGADPDAFSKSIARSLVEQANVALDKMRNGASDSSLTLEDSVALEAVLHTRGRPALRVEGDRIEAITEEHHPGSSFWMPFLDDNELAIVAATAATGAVHVVVDFGDTFIQGTAWLIGKDLAVTNRHVLFPENGLRLARRLDEDPSAARLKTGQKVSLDFGFDNGPPGRKLICPVLDVPFVSAETDPIDVAILRIDPSALASAIAPLKVSANKFDRDQLYIIGHPGTLNDIPTEVNAVFGSPDERKRVSLGELLDSDASRPNEYTHDASTIGGYSGGCMLGFGLGEREVVGLHHLGSTLSGNRAFKSTVLLAHPVAQFFK